MTETRAGNLDGGRPDPSDEGGDDPRLDTSAWRVFGRRLPRRWSLYFRVVAFVVLILALVWWFTRDVTYIGNVKLSGLDATPPELQQPLRELSEEFAALVNELQDRGYAWQSGGLPAMRAAEALTAEEAEHLLAVGSLEVAGGANLVEGGVAAELATAMKARGWRLANGDLEGASLAFGPLTAVVSVRELDGRRQRLVMNVLPAGETSPPE